MAMRSIQEYIELARSLGIEGPQVLEWAQNERKLDIAERDKERSVRKEEREALSREAEAERAYLLAKLESEERVQLARIAQEGSNSVGSDPLINPISSPRADFSQGSTNRAKRPNLPKFDDKLDDLDCYLTRFQLYAETVGWPREEWATALHALLTGKALETVTRLSSTEITDFHVMKCHDLG